jgi:2-haloacid dehalogenase
MKELSRQRAQLRAACVCVAALAAIALRPAGGAPTADVSSRPIAAVAFDYLALFNADAVADDLERMLPSQGRDVAALWRTRQFEYCWLRARVDSPGLTTTAAR